MIDPVNVIISKRLHAQVTACNSDYVKFRPHRQRNMVPLNPDRFAVNQDAMVKLIGWMGNMTISNRSLNAVMVE